MKIDDEIGLWLTRGILRSSGENIQVMVLDSLQEEVERGKDLGDVLEQASKPERQPGDFGAEFVVPIILPILIEAAKEFWSAYASEVQKKAAAKLATLTVDAVKDALRSIFRERKTNDASGNLQDAIRRVANERGLDDATTQRLVAVIEAPDFVARLDETG
jgi:hypothetical protein